MTHQTDHLDPRLSLDERADLLARAMTTVEKCHQLTAVPPWWLKRVDGSDPDGVDDLLAKAPGHVCNFATDDPASLAEIVGRVQRTAVTRTRLGIPLLFHAEALNGFMAGGHVVFPTAIGLAATWSADLVQEMADVIRHQMKRTGIRQALSPEHGCRAGPAVGTDPRDLRRRPLPGGRPRRGLHPRPARVCVGRRRHRHGQTFRRVRPASGRHQPVCGRTGRAECCATPSPIRSKQPFSWRTSGR